MSTDEAEFAAEEINNGTLQKAIRYMLAEGHGDPLDVYLERVQMLNEHVLQHYAQSGKSFDPRLYQRLQTMVREVQNDVQDIGEEASSLASDSSSSVQVLYRDDESDLLESSSVEELFREDDLLDPDLEFTEIPRKYKTQTESVSWAPSSRTLQGDDLEKQYLYGGPDNDPEKWYKGLPPVLPFGETPYMERWESMKINYDLNQSARKTGGEAIVETAVPYEAVEPENPKYSFLPSKYDSGSHFKLPTMPLDHWSRHRYHGTKMQELLSKIVDSFNSGGPLQIEKNYAPRIFLPQVFPIQYRDRQWQNLPSATPFTTSGRTGTSPRVVPSPTLKKFAQKRELAARRDSAARKEKTPASKVVPTSSAARSEPGPSTTVRRVETPKRGRGRPRKIAVADPSYHPPRKPSVDDEEPQTPTNAETNDLLDTGLAQPKKARPHRGVVDKNYRPSQSPLTPTKRKRDLNLDYEEQNRKPKAPRKRNSVGFVGEEPEPASLAKPSRKAAPLKSAIKKAKGLSPEERDILEAAKAMTSPKKRGTTRSGAVAFKPLRLRSQDNTK